MSAFPKRSSREERHRFRDIGFFFLTEVNALALVEAVTTFIEAFLILFSFFFANYLPSNIILLARTL